MSVMPRPASIFDPLIPLVAPEDSLHGAGSAPQPAILQTTTGYGCTYAPLKTHGVELAVKRFLDVVIASSLVVLLAPVFLIVGVMVMVDSPGPVFYRQSRVGRHLRLFHIWKFRTMHVGAHLQRGVVEPLSPLFPLFKPVEDPRATRVGRVLRRWSLDELPQLWNVFRGDMSLVGPRPRLPEEVLADGLRQSIRLGMRPGVTGPWQVNGRVEIPYADGVALDLGYVRNWSLAMDLRVMAKTPRAIISRKGAR
jgi:lipopolysaccharide/colanic/teichoic acid biosynthesis glycosyltransferase